MTNSQKRRVIITGAGGDIGSAAARRFAGPATSLALFDRKDTLTVAVADECRELGSEVITIAADQTDRDTVDDAVSAVVAKFGGIDVLFANAGFGKFQGFLDQSDADWRRHVDVNLNGTFGVCHAVAQQMTSQNEGGCIVVNASSGAVQYTTLLSAYCVTKAALGMLVQAMAAELAAFDIRVNGVMPGVIETGMTAPVLDHNERQRRGLIRRTPAGRLGRPEDIANAVAYLCSPEASFVTGHSIAVDGGQTVLGQPQWYVTDYSQKREMNWSPTE
ncbi:SDR family oxidoreductase [Amycolatopsis sp. K13G38]|uniref:SDR family oxidoreductase n=1 Tax=Amycolatopsis acididurans TaxID=2724524 RepID=A0ABX1JCG5_9PSEU|nr:SDR family NAD(P)-dependent oxidoreductase [Amycolatopsis acididurans]NKQ56116.1 SDR family oxidoreductase [Amycolatopsis acididurans]